MSNNPIESTADIALSRKADELSPLESFVVPSWAEFAYRGVEWREVRAVGLAMVELEFADLADLEGQFLALAQDIGELRRRRERRIVATENANKVRMG